PVIRAADVALFNLETPVSSGHPTTRFGVRFNVHEDFVRALFSVGFDAASVANNHAFDLGAEGVGDTLSAFASVGMGAIGAAFAGSDPLEPREIALAGRTLCVFAATRILNYPLPAPTSHQARVALARPSVAREQNALLEAVRSHRSSCGAII